MVLRATRPEMPRPYRVWAYPLPPIIFSVITHLDDVLSVALEDRSNRWRDSPPHSLGVLLYLLRRNAPATLLHEKRRLKKDRTFPVCRQNRESSAAAPRSKTASGIGERKLQDTFWSAAMLAALSWL